MNTPQRSFKTPGQATQTGPATQTMTLIHPFPQMKTWSTTAKDHSDDDDDRHSTAFALNHNKCMQIRLDFSSLPPTPPIGGKQICVELKKDATFKCKSQCMQGSHCMQPKRTTVDASSAFYCLGELTCLQDQANLFQIKHYQAVAYESDLNHQNRRAGADACCE